MITLLVSRDCILNMSKSTLSCDSVWFLAACKGKANRDLFYFPVNGYTCSESCCILALIFQTDIVTVKQNKNLLFSDTSTMAHKN